MTPAITSANLEEAAREEAASAPTDAESFDFPLDAQETTINQAVQTENPHIQYFNSSRWGYSIVEFTRDDATYVAYDVDKEENSPQADRQTLVAFRTPVGSDELTEVTDEYTPAEPTTESG